MVSLFRVFVLVLFFCDCNGQLSMRPAEPIIAGRPSLLYCHIPNFNGVGEWRRSDEEYYITQCDNTGFCSSTTEGAKYSYSSNATGMLATINNIDRTEQKTWTCDHTSDDPVSYSISYDDNVFVIPTSLTVGGLEQNITLGVNDLHLTFTTTCMNPEPVIRLYYTIDNRNVTITTNTESVNTSGSCLAPESQFEGSLIVSSQELCSATVSPKLLVSPAGLSFQYTRTEWSSSSYITFPICQATTRLTTDTAFGYSLMFTLIGIIIASLVAIVIYKLLLITGKLSFVVLEATETLKVKVKLFLISTVLTLLLCLIIAAIVVVAECGTECTDYTIGTSAAFLVPGIAVHMLAITLVVYVFVRCCNTGKDGVTKMEEDHMSDNGGKSGRTTVTPSAIDVKTTLNYNSGKPLHIGKDNFMSSEDLRKSRSFSETTNESFDLRTDRTHISSPRILDNKRSATEKGQTVVKNHAPDSETNKPSIERSVPVSQVDAAYETTKHPKHTKSPSESSRSSSTINSNKVSPYTEMTNDYPQQKSQKDLQQNEKEINVKNQDSHSLSSHASNQGFVKHRPHSMRGITDHERDQEGGLSPPHDYVANFSSDNQSKVIVMPDDSSSCIISVPTGDGLELELALSSMSSGDDEEALQNQDSQSKGKKPSKKKKKKKWRKKKTVAPENSENVDIVKSKPKKLKSKSKKKKEKIIV